MYEKNGCINILNLVKIRLNYILFKLEIGNRKQERG
jgi:hypothetical protein